MRIALATCRDLPDWEVDDAPLHEALRARGVDLQRPAWDDPSFDWSSCDACLIRTTWDYTERCEEFVTWAERISALTQLHNSAEIVRWNTHKGYLRDLESNGLPIIPTRWLEAGSQVSVARELSVAGWTRAFLKPAIGATARETLRFDADEAGVAAAESHLARVLSHEDMMLQPYLERVETTGEVSAIWIDGRITHCVRKVPVAGDYRVQDDFGAHDEPAAFTSEQRDLACRIVESVPGDLLYARVDFLESDDGDLLLTELEVVEPSLFFRHGPEAAEALADALCKRAALKA